MIIKVTAIFDIPENDKISEDKMFQLVSKHIMLKSIKVTEGIYKNQISGQITHIVMMTPGLECSNNGIKIHDSDCETFQGGECTCKD